MIIHSARYLLENKPGLARMVLESLLTRGVKYGIPVDELTDEECVTVAKKLLEALEPVH